MARAWTGIRIAVACTVFSALCLAAGPAHAGVGDLIDGAVGRAGGGVVGDTVEDGVDGTVGRVTGSSDAVLKDTARKVTTPAEPSRQEAPSGPRGNATKLSQAAAELLRDIPRVVGSEPQNDMATPASDTSSDASSNAPPQRQKADGGQPARERTSDVRRTPRTSAHDDSMHRRLVAMRGARQVAAALAPHVDAPCASGSLAVRDLRRCARAGTPLPGLGGFPRILPPVGLVMVGMGLILVARGRRRGTCVGPAI